MTTRICIPLIWCMMLFGAKNTSQVVFMTGVIRSDMILTVYCISYKWNILLKWHSLLYEAEQFLVNVLFYCTLDSFKGHIIIIIIIFPWQWLKKNHQSLSGKNIMVKSAFNVWPILKVSQSDLWCGKENMFYYACFLSASHSTTITTSLCDVRGD